MTPTHTDFDEQWLADYCARTGKRNPLERQTNSDNPRQIRTKQDKLHLRGHRGADIGCPRIKESLCDSFRISESDEQISVMQWAEANKGKWPELKLLHHIPNGGARKKGEAGRMKAEGVKSGVPDLHLPVARGKWHSLWIEMKAVDGKPSREQMDWVKALDAEENLATICYGAGEAIEVIRGYLEEDAQ